MANISTSRRRQRLRDSAENKARKKPRFSVVTGDSGYRVYDREQTSHYAVNGRAVWFARRESAMKLVRALNDMWSP